MGELRMLYVWISPHPQALWAGYANSPPLHQWRGGGKSISHIYLCFGNEEPHQNPSPSGRGAGVRADLCLKDRGRGEGRTLYTVNDCYRYNHAG
jgi:hypothetical protein